MKDYKQILALDDKSLQKELTEERKEYKKIKYMNSQGGVKDTSSIKKKRITVARMKTAERQHQLAQIKTS